MKAEELFPFYHRIFTLEELRNCFHESSSAIKTQLSRLTKKGVLIRLKKNCYTFTRFPAESPTIGQQIVSPSYLSLETVLSRQGIIPEGAIAYTFITSKKTQHYQTPFGIFYYRHLPAGFFFGVEKAADGVWMATKEKALLDYLYLNSSKFTLEFACFQAERFDQLDALNWNQLQTWAKKYGMKKLEKLVKKLHEYSKSEEYQAHL